MGCGEKITRVVAALIEVEGRLLVCQRGTASVRGGLWEFPGGKAELGESLEEALRREIREELGIELAPKVTFLGWADCDYGDEVINLFGFVAQAADPALLPLNEQNILSAPAEIKVHLLTPPDQHLLEVYIQQQQGI